MERQSTEAGAAKKRNVAAKKLDVELNPGRIGDLGMNLRVAEEKNSNKAAVEKPYAELARKRGRE
jgi:hypothetical protein